MQAVSAYDDPQIWLRSPAYKGPLTDEQINSVQNEINSIMGVTRDNKPIMKLVWNGDRTHWKRLFRKWDSEGKPVSGVHRRPIVLYKQVFNGTTHIRDTFPPRYLLLTRIEPEQYHDEWKRDCEIYHPRFRKNILLKPEQPPAEWYVWLKTIAHHDAFCCAQNEQNISCFGRYAHPNYCFDELRLIRKGLDAGGFSRNEPFMSPDKSERREIEGGLNNYDDDALESWGRTMLELAESTPLAFAGPKLLESGASVTKLRENAREQVKREIELRTEKHQKDGR